MPFFQNPPLHDFPDRAHRELLTQPDNLREFIDRAVPQFAPHLRVEQARLLERELPLPDWRRREVDLFFEMPWQEGTSTELAWVCVQVEHQSQAEAPMPLRTLLHAVLYWDVAWQAWERSRQRGQALHLRVVVPIIFHAGPQPWHTQRNLRHLVDAPPALASLVPDWEPLLWDLADQSADKLLEATGPWQQAMAVVRSIQDDADVFLQRYVQALRQLEPLHQQNRMRWHDLVWFLFSYAIRRRPVGERQRMFTEAVASQQTVILREEVKTMSEQVIETYEDWCRKHYGNIGRSEGIREMLVRQAMRKFGPAPDALEKALQHITDLERLQRMSERVLEVASWEDLLATP